MTGVRPWTVNPEASATRNEFGVKLRRMQPADVHPNRAAAVDIGADILSLLGIGNGVSLDPQLFASLSAVRAMASYCS